jgi:ribosomal protein S18 acetylase RimI-like enzyme
MVLFYFDLPKEGAIPKGTLAKNLKVERVATLDRIDAQDFRQITDFWNPEVSRRNLSERIEKGASLWLIRWDGRIAGYGWTMTGRTIAPHYHPLGANDVHLFDFLVYPEFRGRNVNPSLVEQILDALVAEGRSRAYIEVREWNRPQLASLAKTPFRRFGVARKTCFCGRTFVEWCDDPDESGSPKSRLTTHEDKTATNPTSMVSR